ncbi:FxsA family protein [Corynebacterium pseudodiphtheriticum]|uniref:FxsA family protein n=1 Tax=Corynebacterium pseudodiphtheriticum TaxID=37637 RepID=UPI001EF6A54F|nr:FxsA family protein [Corynebacterium pseudodiphtheriticum]MCG7252232.1 FxsA family protein [Corynebacterium pseudodiphtheriticum]MDK4328939.1 FxsA family protein [Corynebacterium pseudodiphtheriticum]
MPFVMFFFYMLAEIFAFWAVASLIGFGWALIALFGTVVLGVIITRIEIRRIAATQASLVQRLHAQRDAVTDDAQNMSAHGQNRKSAGDIGLTLAGALLLSIPGFATAILGLLLVFPLTRPIIRGFLLGRMYRRVEKLGVRFFQASPTARKHSSYGSFGFPRGAAASNQQSAASSGVSSTSNDDVLDEDELRKWSESMNPEDFSDHRDGGEESSASGDNKPK